MFTAARTLGALPKSFFAKKSLWNKEKSQILSKLKIVTLMAFSRYKSLMEVTPWMRPVRELEEQFFFHLLKFLYRNSHTWL